MFEMYNVNTDVTFKKETEPIHAELLILEKLRDVLQEREGATC